MKKIQIILLFIFLIPFYLIAQKYEPSKNDLEAILKNFINYRYGTISIYQLKSGSVEDLRDIIKLSTGVEQTKTIDSSLLKTLEPRVLEIIIEGAKLRRNSDRVIESIEDEGYDPPSNLEDFLEFFKDQSKPRKNIQNCFLVTTRSNFNEIPSTIIALIVTTESEDKIAQNLKSVDESFIYTYDEMKAMRLDSKFAADNLYDLMVSALIQGNVLNKTVEAQGIGNPEWFAKRKFGISSSLVKNENDAFSEDIQNFVRISEGQALDYGPKENELIVSPDLISWKRYSKITNEDGTDNLTANSNSNLPKFGLELRYGLEDINYPSFWSERMSLSAIWESVKLGLILPTDGWASMGKDVYNIERKLTYGGFGVTGSFDFPFKVIPKSGIFKFNFGYVFGDANESKYKNRKIDPNNYDPNLALLFDDFDYLVRLNAQLHYTFAISVDENYWFRFGIGGTIYNVERWYNDLDTSVEINKLKFRKFDDETVGGISGRIEFMSKNIITPFGAFVQYFDESMSAGLWLQIPIIEKTLALRLDAKGFFSAFKSQPHAWESKSVFVPSARLIVNF